MTSSPWTDQDLSQMREMGIDPAEASRQLSLFENPPKPLELIRSAMIQDGIFMLTHSQIEQALKTHESACRQGRFSKFVPASGAATRMFHLLLKFVERPGLTREELQKESAHGVNESRQLIEFMDALPKMAFADELDQMMAEQGLNLRTLLQKGEYGPVLRSLLTTEGLGYSQKPKGLLQFHFYPSEKRTPFEEHLFEAVHYCQDERTVSKVHFTVSQEHIESFKKDLQSFLKKRSHDKKVRFEVDFSVQKPSTLTLAVDEKNQPFRNDKNRIVFRPAGHGALLENLNDIRGDLVYIKNIDNVTVESALFETIRWKRILGGCLAEIQEKIFSYLKVLGTSRVEKTQVDLISDFSRTNLLMDLGDRFESYSLEEKIGKLKKMLNRPLRVCGVVPNTGEPGGGPFWVRSSNGNVSLQIVESAQIDHQDPSQRKIFEKSSHFNPVDLVCGLKDWHGKAFDLKDYSDPGAVFISRKSMNGRELKALELPGLWNGAMADWITVFVDVPIETFNPVKTVLDLLKPAHQP